MVCPKISFGMIVLNGEPFTRYSIQQLYPYAHEIIIAEGACLDSSDISDENGHSTDGTLSILWDLKMNHDPDDKIVIVIAEDEGHPDGFWPGEKLEQSQAWARRATGDYIWQIDVDEFYRQKDIENVIRILSERPEIDCVEFTQIPFWGHFDFQMDGWYFQIGTATISKPQREVYRVSRWGKGFHYADHRPQGVRTPGGSLTRDQCTLSAEQTARIGLYMYHYVAIFRHQIEDKLKYYEKAKWKKSAAMRSNDYLLTIYEHFDRHPFQVHFVQNYPSWLLPFKGRHPEAIEFLMADLAEGIFPGVTMLERDTIATVIRKPQYRFKRFLFRIAVTIYPVSKQWIWRFRYYFGCGSRQSYIRLRAKIMGFRL